MPDFASIVAASVLILTARHVLCASTSLVYSEFWRQ